MKGVIYIDSCFYEVEFEKFPSCSYRHSGFLNDLAQIMPGSMELVSIDWENLVFTTKTKINGTLKINPFVLFCVNGNSLYDNSAYFVNMTAEMDKDNKTNYEYTIALSLPRICFGKKETTKSIPSEINNLYKVYLVKKRLEQNKK